MDGGRAALFAEADGKHFHESTFPVVAESRVGLDTIDDDDGIRLGRVHVGVNRHTLWCAADLYTLHVAADWYAQFCQTIADQDLALPFGCAATVAAHGWNEEGQRAPFQKRLDQRRYNFSNTGDAAAAQAHGDAHAGLDALSQVGGGKLAAHMGRNIANVIGRQVLAHRGQVGEGCHTFAPLLD